MHASLNSFIFSFCIQDLIYLDNLLLVLIKGVFYYFVLSYKMVAESWFRSLWKTSKKHEAGSEKAIIRVLAFEVASMMSKLVHLWQYLNDKQVARLREEIMNSVGIRKLVSEDDDFIVSLICAEIVENLRHLLMSVARLSHKYNETSLKSFRLVFDEFVKTGADPYGWEFSWKKMERKIKKMERFILANANLYQEMEMLS